ncbi:transcription termination factor 2, mitochondrial [Protopterus annectens]|uniref:transcription termination factor 2, mitochondrial n=1 Tax=Protopterus annectens TaxID=7888 RepID=UPI001CFC3CCD|nr:transcription termination factor 2, mitochondrial [Protopterus annectens]XP_043943528.1 transcription termination factor 2, mitochondrial [Protopterus annectens]
MLQRTLFRYTYYQQILTLSSVWHTQPNGNFLHQYGAVGTGHPGGENQNTINKLQSLSVDVEKIRKQNGWILFEHCAYVDEVAGVLKEMGSSSITIVSILERYPEAVLRTPAEIKIQRELWRSLTTDEQELVRIIEKFPDSFFGVDHHVNQKCNIVYFQGLNLSTRIIAKFLATAAPVFCNVPEKNKEMIEVLQQSYCNLGGSESNMRAWLLKLLIQNPFVLLKCPTVVKENLSFFYGLGFTNSEVLLLLAKVRGFIAESSPHNMQESLLYIMDTLKCSTQEMKSVVLEFPFLFYFPVPVLEERINNLLKDGISVDQIKEEPSVLELTVHIVQYRMQKLIAADFDVKNVSLKHLSGTKKDFEANYRKLQVKKERPLFNPVTPLHDE